MDRVRIYELSRDLGTSPKEVLALLEELGVEVKSHASTVDAATAQALKELILEQRAAPPAPRELPPLQIAGTLSVAQLASQLNLSTADLISQLLPLGIAKTANQMLTEEELEKAAEAFGRRLVVEAPPPPRPEVTRPRRALKPSTVPPVVVVMGHVDHGKTTLLDAIRNTKVTEQEHGGITQHIGASEILHNGRRIVFLDTPGHEAFTHIRARGAQVTDIAVIVVAADEGVMPQTIEAIDHGRAAEVPMVVVINKTDLPTANVERTRQQLAAAGVVPEEWGGETVFVEASAKARTGIDELLEMLLLVADIKGLEARMDGAAEGVVIESKLDASRGPLATVVVKEGTLRRGDTVLSGAGFGKVRQMTNWLGKPLAQALPGTPVEVAGLSEVPVAGDTIISLSDPREAKAIIRQRQDERKRQADAAQRRPSFDDLLLQIQRGEAKELRLVLKADVQGSLDALSQALSHLQEGEVVPRILHQGVGDISESDILLASAASALVVGFNVRTDAAARRLAQLEKIQVRLYTIIYHFLDDARNLLKGLIEPELREVALGAAEVRQVFRISRLGVVAGCYVTGGRIVRGEKARVLRGGEKIHDSAISSLRHLQEDVAEIAAGFECGIMVEGFADFQEGDLIEAYQIQEVIPS